MNEPLPIYKGLFVEMMTGKRVHAFFLKHNADAGESESDDCFLTLSEKLEGGEHNCGEAGLYPVADFRQGLKFLCLPKPPKSFGA